MTNKYFGNQDAIQILNPKDDRWLEFVTKHPQAGPFHHPAWISVLSECYRYKPFILVAFDEGGGISAGLPMMEVRSMITGRRWVSLPFTDYCTPLYNDLDSLNKLTDNLASVCQNANVPKIEIRWDLPTHEAFQSHTSYYLHTLKLGSDPQVVLKGFKRTHRQNIGTAEERGVRIDRGNDLEYLHRFYAMQMETRRRKGLPVQPWRFFDLLGKQILAQGLGFILLAYKDTECLAGGFFLHWQQTLIYKYAASSSEEQQFRPNNLLSWTAMRWGCENGYTIFDLGRTELNNEGLRRFKNGWGAQETPLPYSIFTAKSSDAGNGKLKSLMGTLIQNGPPWVCRITGELLYRHFG